MAQENLSERARSKNFVRRADAIVGPELEATGFCGFTIDHDRCGLTLRGL